MFVKVRAVGYFVHVMRGATTRRVNEAHTCAVDVPGWEHQYGLLIRGNHAPGAESRMVNSVFKGWQQVDLGALSAKAGGDGSLDLELKLDGKPAAPLTYARGKFVKGKPVDWSCLNLLAGGPDIFVGTTLDRDNWNSKSGIQARFTYSRGCLSSEVRVKPDPIVWEWKGRRRTLRQPVASALCYTSPDVTPSASGTTPVLVVRSRANGKVLARIPLQAKTARGTVEIEFRSTYGRDGYAPENDSRDAYLLMLAHAHATLRFMKANTNQVIWNARPKNRGVLKHPSPKGVLSGPSIRTSTEVGCNPATAIDPPPNP